MANCDQCRWKVERKECPWDYLYDDDTNCAQYCCDFRHIEWESDAFDNENDLKGK